MSDISLDRDRRQRLSSEKAEAEAAIARIAEIGETATSTEELRVLRDRIASIEEELNRMDFAAEIERQSDA